jgi:hypothetical protein
MRIPAASAAPRPDIYWRRALLAAHLLWRNQERGLCTARDRRLGGWLKSDPGVTNRLIDQAIASLEARRRTRHANH